MEINLTDTLSPILANLQGDKLMPRILARMRVAVVNLLKQHYTKLEASRPNKLGGKRTHFWELAGNSITWLMRGNGFNVDVNKVGVRLHLIGGTVKPGVGTSSLTGRPTRLLTIPVDAEAHGRRAAEFSNLVPIYKVDGGKLRPWALAVGTGGAALAGRKKLVGEKLSKKTGTGHMTSGLDYMRKGKKVSGSSISIGAKDDAKSRAQKIALGKGHMRILFILASKTVHTADPSTFPTEGDIEEACVAAGSNYITSLTKPKGGAS